MPAAEPCRYNIEKDIAAFIKKEFDKRLVPELMRYTVQPARSDLKGAMTLLQQCGKVLTSARLLLMLVYVCTNKEVQSHLALRGGPKLRFLCDPRDEAFHLLLPGPGRGVSRKHNRSQLLLCLCLNSRGCSLGMS